MPASRVPLPYNVRVGDVMTPRPVIVGAKGSLLDALVLMRTHRVSGLPVLDSSGHLVGVLSQKDLARVVAGASLFPDIAGLLDVLMVGLAEHPEMPLRRLREVLENTRVEEVMSSPPLVVRPDASLEFAAEAMNDNEIHRLPVVTEDRLLGIVTPHDLVRGIFPAAPSRRRRK